MWLWKFFGGYAKIKVICTRPERFVNSVLSRGCSLHNIERTELGAFTANIRLKEYDQIAVIADELHSEIRLIARGGASVLMEALLARKALLFSLSAALALMVFFSGRILMIEVHGGIEGISDAVRSILDSENAVILASASKIDRSSIARQITALDDRIDHVKVQLDGVRLTVEIFGDAALPPASDDRPASIYANKDCIIISIASMSGRELVKSGDPVRRDQLLISGDITPEGGTEAVLTRAEGEIIGEAAYSIEICIEPAMLHKARSGRTETAASSELFGLRLEPEFGFEGYDCDFKTIIPFDSSFLPVKVLETQAFELALTDKQLTREEMIAEAERQIQDRINSAIPSDALIVSKATEFIWNDDGSLSVRITVHTYEKIGYLRNL